MAESKHQAYYRRIAEHFEIDSPSDGQALYRLFTALKKAKEVIERNNGVGRYDSIDELVASFLTKLESDDKSIIPRKKPYTFKEEK
ncbi:hypothetical protein RGU76_04605 [Bacillus pseudomycoides]|uniref:hypothetical protein n=1 Tax=Bacillus TaxID=1386 RepID=UPI0022488FB2|nr:MULTISPECIES: hypothetical protein [Bacillus]MCX2826565.1 hypothetical protein [Bacillus sp. DHT2]MDR4914412.1 hypothetical protein [Bacillus pseudomycoides]